jgi:hypothetical protein
MNINTRDFWKTVKCEYIKTFTTSTPFLCENSDTFMIAFKSEMGNKLIKSMGRIFLRLNRMYYKNCSVGSFALFFTPYGMPKADIRLAFLDFCINFYKQ